MAARIVLHSFGSLGDVHPYLALGRALHARGHRVVVATSRAHGAAIRAAGLDFHPTAPHFDPTDPDLVAHVMHPRRGTAYVLRELIAPHLLATYRDLSAALRGADLLVGGSLAYTAPLAAETSGLPWVSSVLAPASFFSAYDPPLLPTAPAVSAALRRLGPAPNRAALALLERLARGFGEPLRALRRDLGLPPAGADPLFAGQHSPRLALALFSPRFGPPQPDWPASAVATGFLFHDRRAPGEGLTDALTRFLEAGEPPLVFTLGSAAVHSPGAFFERAVDLARKLGRRAVLLSGGSPPAALPRGVIAAPYAPHGELFPRAAAIVHHGGVGTTAEALRAGRPALVVPFSHDQFDNAARVRRLGVGLGVAHPAHPGAARRLARLLEEKRFSLAAARLGAEIRAEDGVGRAAAAIEAVLAAARRDG